MCQGKLTSFKQYKTSSFSIKQSTLNPSTAPLKTMHYYCSRGRPISAMAQQLSSEGEKGRKQNKKIVEDIPRITLQHEWIYSIFSNILVSQEDGFSYDQYAWKGCRKKLRLSERKLGYKCNIESRGFTPNIKKCGEKYLCIHNFICLAKCPLRN